MNTPLKIHIWNPNMEVWKMIFFFNPVIFRLHVNFQGRRSIPVPSPQQPVVEANVNNTLHLPPTE